jgi:hypothetical protein
MSEADVEMITSEFWITTVLAARVAVPNASADQSSQEVGPGQLVACGNLPSEEGWPWLALLAYSGKNEVEYLAHSSGSE